MVWGERNGMEGECCGSVERARRVNELVRLTIDIPLVGIASLSLQLIHIFTYFYRFVTVSL